MILNIRNVVTLSKTQYFEISIAIKKKEKTDLSCKRTIGYLDKDSIEIYIFQKYNHFAASGAELKLKFLYLNERTLTKLFNGDTIYLFFLNVSFLRCTTIQLKRGIRFRILDNSFIGICSAETLHIPRLHLAPGIGTRSLREEEFHGGITFQYTSGEQI